MQSLLTHALVKTKMFVKGLRQVLFIHGSRYDRTFSREFIHFFTSGYPTVVYSFSEVEPLSGVWWVPSTSYFHILHGVVQQPTHVTYSKIVACLPQILCQIVPWQNNCWKKLATAMINRHPPPLSKLRKSTE